MERPRDVDEGVNYVAAMKLGVKRLSELPVSVRLIREIHAHLMQGVRGGHLTPGELRSSPNWIGPMGATLTGTRVLEMLYNKPIVAVADVASLNGTSFAAANTLIARLEQLGILNEVTGPHPSRIMRTQRKASRQRPYVVAELVRSFLYHGRLWTVGCLTEEAAEASFRRRVARNLAQTGSPGAVIACRRQGRQPLCWTDEVLDAKTMLKHRGC